MDLTEEEQLAEAEAAWQEFQKRVKDEAAAAEPPEIESEDDEEAEAAWREFQAQQAKQAEEDANAPDEGLVDSDEYFIDYEHLTFIAAVAEGSFGRLFKGEYLGVEVAIKDLFLTDDAEEDAKYLAREISALKAVRHPNVVSFIGVCQHETGSYIVTEWVPKGDLTRELREAKPISWQTRLGYAKDTAAAMAYLHAKNVIHRDLKAENLLLSESGHIKVCDLGFARRVGANMKQRRLSIAGTQLYMAPEVIMGAEYDEKCDVYCFGVVLFELAARRPPPEREEALCFNFDLKKLFAFVQADCPPEMLTIISDCVQTEPSARPSFRDVLARIKSVLATLPPEPEQSGKASQENDKEKQERKAKKLAEKQNAEKLERANKEKAEREARDRLDKEEKARRDKYEKEEKERRARQEKEDRERRVRYEREDKERMERIRKEQEELERKKKEIEGLAAAESNKSQAEMAQKLRALEEEKEKFRMMVEAEVEARLRSQLQTANATSPAAAAAAPATAVAASSVSANIAAAAKTSTQTKEPVKPVSPVPAKPAETTVPVASLASNVTAGQSEKAQKVTRLEDKLQQLQKELEKVDTSNPQTSDEALKKIETQAAALYAELKAEGIMNYKANGRQGTVLKAETSTSTTSAPRKKSAEDKAGRKKSGDKDSLPKRKKSLLLLNKWEEENLSATQKEKVLAARQKRAITKDNNEGLKTTLSDDQIRNYKQQMIEKYKLQQAENERMLRERKGTVSGDASAGVWATAPSARGAGSVIARPGTNASNTGTLRGTAQLSGHRG